MTEDKNKQNIVKELIQKIDQNPKDAGNYYALATVLVKQQSFDQAEELLVKARGLFTDTKSVDLLTYGLGNVYYESGLYEKANIAFQSIQDEQLKQDANLMIAQGYFAQSQYKLAFVFALTAWEKNADDADANELMGDINLALGDAKSAQKYYDTALQSKKTAKLLFNRGVVEMTLTQKKNNSYFEKAKEIDATFFENSKQRLIDIDKLLNESKEDI
jgi:tetratricopeptide (TPR) repeat protein